MATCSSFWLALAILFSTAATNDSATMFAYVNPSSASNVSCPDQPCLMFNDYARENDQYFLDGTSFIFLPGVHQLDLRLRLENISNVSLLTLLDDSVQILLSPMANITWIDCNNITITGLEVYLSGQPAYVSGSLFSALAFQRTSSFLSRLSFFGNDSWESTAIRTHSSVVNLRDVMVSGARSMYGAALIAFNSIINFVGQIHFLNNTAIQGGAVVISQSMLISVEIFHLTTMLQLRLLTFLQLWVELFFVRVQSSFLAIQYYFTAIKLYPHLLLKVEAF